MWINCKVFMAKSTSPSAPEMPAFPPSPVSPNFPVTFPINSVPAACRQDSSQHHHHPTRYDIEAGIVDNRINTKKYVTQRSWTSKTQSLKLSLRKLYIFVALTFCLLLGANAVLLMFIPQWNYAARTNFMCVECSQLRLSSDISDDYSEGMERALSEGVIMCCATNYTQQQRLIDALVERKLRERSVGTHLPPQAQYGARTGDYGEDPEAHTTAHNDTTAPPVDNQCSAQLFLNEAPESAPELRFQALTGWMDPSGAGEQNFVRSGIEFDATRGRLIIRETGLYMVYSQLVFRGPQVHLSASGTPSTPPATLFSQMIMQEKSGTAQPQAQLEDTALIQCSEPEQMKPCHTSHISSQLMLHKGDEIFIIAKPALQLKAGGRLSFFGLYRLSD